MGFRVFAVVYATDPCPGSRIAVFILVGARRQKEKKREDLQRRLGLIKYLVRRR